MDTTASHAFERSDRAPGEARRFVARTLSTWTIADACAGALLAVSELVTNALTHGRGAVHVRLSVCRATLRVEVEDEGPGPREADRRPPRPDTVGGHGLHIVEQLASRWGTLRPGRGRSIVWFETPCPA